MTKLLPHDLNCRFDGDGAEDAEMGKCLKNSAIFVDERDDKMEKRFFPVGVQEHMKRDRDENYWYPKNQYYKVAQGNLSCCSDVPAGFHYVIRGEDYLLEYLIYHVHPFGLTKNLTETLPRKLKLKDILRASDAESSSPNFVKKPTAHDLEPSEIYI